MKKNQGKSITSFKKEKYLFGEPMGFLEKLTGKKPEETTEPKEETPVETKYAGQKCALCSGPNPEKKWMGQYWHKKCLRSSKKMARKMV